MAEASWHGRDWLSRGGTLTEAHLDVQLTAGQLFSLAPRVLEETGAELNQGRAGHQRGSGCHRYVLVRYQDEP
jgi:hypothetical protein